MKEKKSMSKNTSISLGNHFELFVENAISQGRYKNASEVIRAGLRILEEEENKVELLKRALIEGEKSGFVDNFNPKEFLEELNNNYSKNAKL